MAVYKATYCYPFLNTIDTRVTVAEDLKTKAQFLKCKVDTSNIDITGYKIRILDENNNQIFPLNNEEGKISPVSELASLINYDDGTNTGVNGTYLNIPFFQNYDAPILVRNDSGVAVHMYSYNAIYYKSAIMASYLLDKSLSENSDWVWNTEEECWEVSMEDSEPYTDGHIIDGELILANQTVLVINAPSVAGVQVNGYFKTYLEESEDGYLRIRLREYGSDIPEVLKNNSLITIIYGEKYHNKIFRYHTNTTPVQDTTTHMWVTYDGSPVVGFNLDGSTYKWEITLYQGEIEHQDSEPWWMDYSELDDKWYDMKLTSGTILGSTSKRIQISDIEETEIPAGTKDNSVILQTRFMRIGGNIKNNGRVDGGDSIYVQSYDATYGHVYPRSGDLESGIIDCNEDQYAQFYKHSNDPTDILNTDIVDFGYDKIVDQDSDQIISIGVGNTISGSSSSTSSVFYISPNSVVYNALIKDGIAVNNLILFTNVHDTSGNSDPKQNGVYVIRSLDTKVYKQGTSEVISNNCITLKRAPSYTTWASYIGKVIYVSAGALAKENIESLANAGTFELYNPLDASNTGSSPLYFTEETPIILFGDKIYKTVDLYIDANYSHTSNVLNIDGIQLKIGNIVLFKDNKYATVARIVKPGPLYEGRVTYENMVDFSGSGDKYVYVSQGQNFGHKVMLNGQINYDLYTAKILKNSTQWTYISPYIGLVPGMKLKLNNNKKIKYSGETNETSWIDIYELDNVLWRVKTKKEIQSAYVLKSFDNTSKDVPWTYELRSYFKTSDQNVFYSYESPYIKIEINSRPFGNFIESVGYAPFMVKEQDGAEERLVPFYVIGDTSDKMVPFYVRTYECITELVGRSINIGAIYTQYQNATWESYRWILLDSNGNVLQDTGKKYNQKIEVNFYGLANDSSESMIYYAVLYVEDNLHNTIQYVVKLVIAAAKQETVSALSVDFHATYDPTTHANLLTYEDQGILKPSFNHELPGTASSFREYAFTAQNSNIKDSSWDSSIFYTDIDGNVGASARSEMILTGIDGQMSAPVYMEYISTAWSDSAVPSMHNSESEIYTYHPSVPMRLGVPFSTYFGRTTNEVFQSPITEEFNSDQILQLGSAEEGYGTEEETNSNEFYLNTRFRLDNNFCGDFFKINVEGVPNESNNNPVYDDDTGVIDLSGYLTFKFKVADNFLNTSDEFGLNPDKNKIYCIIEKKSKDTEQHTIAAETAPKYFSVETQEGTEKIFVPYVINPESHYRYYLQYKDNIEEGYEYLPFDLSENVWHKLILKDRYEDNQYITSIAKFLGNLCLVRDDDDVLTTLPTSRPGRIIDIDNYDRLKNGAIYWTENRPYLKTIENLTINIDGQDEEMFLLSDKEALHIIDYDSSLYDENIMKWPSGAKENDCYWIEGTNISSNQLPFAKWEDVQQIKNNSGEDISHFEQNHLVLGKGIKHYGINLDNKYLRLYMEIKDIKSMYNDFDNIILSDIADDSTIGKLTLCEEDPTNILLDKYECHLYINIDTEEE